MKILVVTPTLGNSPWLAETVASVAAQGVNAVHVLVAPADGVAKLATEFSRCLVVAEPSGGRGMYAAVNAGAAAVDSWEAITYLNDDDVLLPGFAAVATALEKRAGQPWLAYGRVRLIDAKGRRLGAIPVSPRPQLNRALYAQRLEPVYQHGMLVSRVAWTEHGGFDPAFRYCGDSEFLARLCVRGVPAVYVSGEVAAFRLRPGQLTGNRPAMLAERLRVDEKLGLKAASLVPRHHWARLVFRVANLPVYVERVFRHGFVSFDQLLARSGAEEKSGSKDGRER